MSDAETKTHPFQAEVAELLRLMVHSVYSETDIFLRELISNASDACDRLRYEAIAKPELMADGAPLAIRIAPDKTAGTLTIADNGIGMDRQELIDNLGTVARSGTRAFMSKLSEAKDGAGLIGQFGVGFYSAFMVADRITVVSRRAGTDETWVWSSDGRRRLRRRARRRRAGGARGARHRDRAAPERRREEISRAAGDPPRRLDLFGSHPVPDRARRGAGQGARSEPKNEQINSASALWQKPKSELKPEDYTQAYQTIAHAFDDPAMTRALPRRGALFVCGAAVRALVAAVRPVRSGAQGPREALRAPRLHHRRRRAAAVLSALHPRRGRQRGPAAQHLARDAAEQSAGRGDPQGDHRPRDHGAGKPRREGRRGVTARSGRPSARC